MRVFVDCEFTDFIDCELISIGLAAEDGREFYGERHDFDRAMCSVFVLEAVLPQLTQQRDPHAAEVYTRDALRAAVLDWLITFDHVDERTLVFDYAGDWELLVDLLDEPPSGWQAVLATFDEQRAEAYYAAHGGRHHALMDARVNRFTVLA